MKNSLIVIWDHVHIHRVGNQTTSRANRQVSYSSGSVTKWAILMKVTEITHYRYRLVLTVTPCVMLVDTGNVNYAPEV